MKKKLLSVVLALAMVLSLMPMAWAEETQTNEVKDGATVAIVDGTSYHDLQTAVDAAVIAGKPVVLQDNVVLTAETNEDMANPIVITGKVTLDMNGKTISNADELWFNGENPGEPNNWSLISVQKGGDLTITGKGALEAKENDCFAVDLQGGQCTIENGTFVGNLSAVYVHDGHLTVMGGNFSIQQKKPTGHAERETLNCRDANYKNETATITVTGGTFKNFNPENNLAEGADTNFCAEGHVGVVEKTEGNVTYYTVKPLADVAVAKIGDKYYRTLEDALNEAVDGNTVMVLKDATIGKAVEIDAGTIEVNLNGKTVSYVPSKSNDDLAIIDINGSANVTVTGNGFFTFTNDYFTSKMDELGYIFRLSGDASLTIENGNYHAVLTCVQAGENATATIQGGIFSTEIEWNGTCWHLNLIDKSNAKFVVTGGTFVDYDPSNSKTENPAANFVDPNYSVTKEGNNYIVQKIENKLVVDKGTVSGNTQSATLAGDFAPNAPVEGDIDSKVEGYDVSIDLSNEGGSTADTVNLTVTKETAKSLVSADSLSVATDAGTVELNAAALDKVGKTEGDVVITVQKNTVDSSDNVKASYTVSVKTGETNLLPYGESNGKVTITVPKGDATVAWYVTGENTSKVYVEKLDTREADGKLAITIGHLSTIELLAADPETTAVATVTVNGKTTGYNTFSDALNAATAGSTIKLLKDVTVEDPITLNKENVVFDGNGNTLKVTSTGQHGAIDVTADNVTIQNIKINSARNYGVQFYNVTGGKLSGTEITGGKYTSVYVNASGDITIENSVLNPTADKYYAAIEYGMGSGDALELPGKVTIDGVTGNNPIAIWTDKASTAAMIKKDNSYTTDNVADKINSNIVNKNSGSIEVNVEVEKDGKPVIDTTTKPGVGSSSSGGSSSSSYTVNVEDSKNGTVTASHKSASKNTTVTLTVKADKGYELDELTVTDKNGKELKLTDKGNGKYTFAMPASKVDVKATFAEIVEKPAYSDVSASAWYAKAVAYVTEKGMMEGDSGKFMPLDKLTRSQMAQVLFNLEGKKSVNYALTFGDMNGTEWYAEAVRWAASEQIVNGYDNGNFGPNDPITREQLVTVLYRYAQYKGLDTATTEENLTSFADAAQVSGYAVSAMNWAVGAGVINGTDSGLAPKATATRAEVAQILMNFDQKF